jgi:hypothetical protein
MPNRFFFCHRACLCAQYAVVVAVVVVVVSLQVSDERATHDHARSAQIISLQHQIVGPRSSHLDLDLAGRGDAALVGRQRLLVDELADQRQLRELGAPLALDLAAVQRKGGAVGGADDAAVLDLWWCEGGGVTEGEGGAALVWRQRQLAPSEQRHVRCDARQQQSSPM